MVLALQEGYAPRAGMGNGSSVQYHRQIALQPYLTCIFIRYCHIIHLSAMEVRYLDLFENMGLGKVVTPTQTELLLI